MGEGSDGRDDLHLPGLARSAAIRAYLTDVLERLPTHKMSAIGELLPHRWTSPAQTTAA